MYRVAEEVKNENEIFQQWYTLIYYKDKGALLSSCNRAEGLY